MRHSRQLASEVVDAARGSSAQGTPAGAGHPTRTRTSLSLLMGTTAGAAIRIFLSLAFTYQARKTLAPRCQRLVQAVGSDGLWLYLGPFA